MLSTFTLVLLMAIPPEPIEEVLPQADAIVLADVTKVLRQDAFKAPPGVDPSMPDSGAVASAQSVELSITRVLKGPREWKPGTKIVVEKPPAGYALREGNKGPFLVKLGKDGKGHVIIGRYGPDTYRLDDIERALKSAH